MDRWILLTFAVLVFAVQFAYVITLVGESCCYNDFDLLLYKGTVNQLFVARREKSKWRNPPSGQLKVNVDGSYRAEFGDGGVGVVIRDENGMCLVALAHYFPHASSALHMEAEACRAGLLLAIHQNMSAIDLESDCSLVITALQHNVEDRSEIGRIIDDCKSYLTSFHPFQVRHIFREANGAANRLAHLASYNYISDVWLEETPVIIRDVLYEDSCIDARGQGFMSPSTRLIHSNIISQAWG
ncbi:uncharacterized protein LOC112168311 [Rosa chinensis]|uniref:uncharacterized protein LOC112168311 n=1 Tax=Rosa chinensis TaxID=74649 RepID=UPI000D08F57A|nr:uncharacterized protein LOC112168311 [Rosa chinensis]